MFATDAPGQDEYLSYQEAAEFLGLTYAGVTQAVRNKRLHPIYLPGRGKFKFIKRAELVAYRDKTPLTPTLPDPRMVGAEAVRGAVEHMVDSYQATLSDLLSKGLASSVAHNATLINAMMGNPEPVDPKQLAALWRLSNAR